MGKFGNTAIKHCGFSFGSKLEAAVYDMLILRQKAGEILEITPQNHVKLTRAKILYIADFHCKLPDGSSLWVEAKGMATPVWGIKRRLWKFYGPGPLEIWNGSFRKLNLKETIIPSHGEEA